MPRTSSEVAMDRPHIRVYLLADETAFCLKETEISNIINIFKEYKRTLAAGHDFKGESFIPFEGLWGDIDYIDITRIKCVTHWTKDAVEQERAWQEEAKSEGVFE